MNVVIRADASARMGTGHVMRCATLAQSLQDRGAVPRFVCREHRGNLIAPLRERWAVHVLPPPVEPVDIDDEDYAAWLGVPESGDAEETIAALGGEKPDWMVVDHYGLGRAWEARLRPHVGRIAVIDDLAGRRHDCDVLLDQNYPAAESAAGRIVPAGCQPLIGPRFALLAPEYARQRDAGRVRDGSVRRVLVYFGGADPSNMTAEALEALAAPEFSRLLVDVVIGTNHPRRQALERQAVGRANIRLHGTRPHLADLMDAADLAIGAGGTTTWERLCLGLPSLVVSLAENQRPACEALAAAGHIAYAGGANSVRAPEIRAAINALVADPDRLAALASRGLHLVDGRGAPRVADALLGEAKRLRTRRALHAAGVCPEGFDGFAFAWIDRCREADVLSMRNAPHVLAQMRSRDPVSADSHARFLAAYSEADRYDFVLLEGASGRYAGTFYVTGLRSAPALGKYIGDPAYLGKGLARRATARLIEFCRLRAGLQRLTAETRQDNARNIALNAALGFELAGMDGEYAVMTLEL
jgi:UDP-2,4-diacetamido-2,4,6-trideoxy-beta-L-altropyranose hydrolase